MLDTLFCIFVFGENARQARAEPVLERWVQTDQYLPKLNYFKDLIAT